MLYIIATPIGNLADITFRAVEVLEKVKILLCEDTRVTGKMLMKLQIKNKPQLVSFYDEVEDQKTPQVLRWLEDGQEVGLVTDAGTPLVSDPGWRLVKRCYDENLPITALPGASAVMNALVLSGLPTDRFVFLGFLPKKNSKQEEWLIRFKDLDVTQIVYESPFRLADLIRSIESLYGQNVTIAICREMTKKFEEVIRGKPVDIKEKLKETIDKGEVVVLWR
ncbi:16S rRNA (cytidine(1402)-2'-O)-methyltransferase [Patescibacteria group bacterium]|nr:16S rRNA (cytidine(1402)-2'-O)-methyltransferase [Patescibacteria group bacterium]